MKNTECRDAQDQLVEYSEGELDKTQQALLARHLETCADCRKELKEIERLRAALAREQAPEPGAAFWESFPERVWRAYQSEQTAEHQRGTGLHGLLERLRLALAAPVLIMRDIIKELKMATDAGTLASHQPEPEQEMAMKAPESYTIAQKILEEIFEENVAL